MHAGDRKGSRGLLILVLSNHHLDSTTVSDPVRRKWQKDAAVVVGANIVLIHEQ